MRFSTPAVLATFLASTATYVAAAAPTWPTTTYIAQLNISITPGWTIAAPIGNRVVNEYLGGTAVDASGKKIADIVPYTGGEGGFMDKNSVFHVSTRGLLNFTDGSGYAFFTCQGIKNGTEYFWVSVDTSSTTYSFLNWAFLIGSGTKVSSADGLTNNLIFDIFTPTPLP
ncbi:hypothetical protein FRB94_010095 [Tulasnella sp. JGI-2019a]|nr:hypothetical protein FRB94_010095 [Tulasnella sp. JGI-2019a]KAG9028424.1 hypothetical protein FRB95_006502 [Tulasnella sp. JGI-2019a]